MNLRKSLAAAAAFAGTIALLGAASRDAAYRPYLGTWSCTRPAMGQGWWGTLTVTPTADGQLRFSEERESPNAPAGGTMYVRKASGENTWTLSSPTYPFVKTGHRYNGAIVFADPYPRKQRFRLSVSKDDKTLTMLSYLQDTQILNLTNFIVTCTRGSNGS
jgi:hypothetical protein